MRLRRLRSLARDNRGLALIEFAFSLPILVLLYLGTYQVSDAMACSRKVTITARSVADLTSQYSAVDAATVTTILAASAQIIYPFDSSKATITVSEIYTDSNGTTKVVWSKAMNGTARTAGTAFTAPASVITKGTYLIVAEVRYAYVPAASFGIVGPLTLGDTIYMSPRLSAAVPLS